jgi:hypothetical protein
MWLVVSWAQAGFLRQIRCVAGAKPVFEPVIYKPRGLSLFRAKFEKTKPPKSHRLEKQTHE